MKYLNRKDFLRRNLFLHIEPEYNRLKSLSFNRGLPQASRFFFFMKLTRLGKNLSKVRIKNRCVFTSRGQAIYRDFHLNRAVLKEFVGSDLLVGVRKSSW